METIDQKINEFKQRVEADWAGDETAAAWQKYYVPMKEQLAEVTKALVEAANPQPGMIVLDIASGTGEPSLSIGNRVAPNGKVIATDLSEGMLKFLAHNAKTEGVTNIETKACDAHDLPFPDGMFDLVTSRFGVMFFGELDRAFAEIRRVLKSGGRVAFMVWGAPIPNSYFGTSVVPYMKRMANKPDPDGPSPMRFAEPGKLVKAVEASGFSDVHERSFNLPAPFRGSPEGLLTKMMEIAAPFRNAAASLSDEDRHAAEQEVFENLRPLYDGTYTNVTAPVIIATAVSE